MAMDPKFKEEVSSLISKYNVPQTSINGLKKDLSSPLKVLLLDVRESDEYNISHLKNALHIPSSSFSLKALPAKVKDYEKIIVYCSAGYRSAKVAKVLRENGLKAYGLFGGIFEWNNQGLPIYNSKNQKTDRIHTFNKSWSKWVTKGKKVY